MKRILGTPMPFYRTTTKKYARYVLRWCIALGMLTIVLYQPWMTLYEALGSWELVLKAIAFLLAWTVILACVAYTCWWAFSND